MSIMKIALDLSPLEMLPGVTVRLTGLPPVTDADLFAVCGLHELWRFEREPNGELLAHTILSGTDGIRHVALTSAIE